MIKIIVVFLKLSSCIPLLFFPLQANTCHMILNVSFMECKHGTNMISLHCFFPKNYFTFINLHADMYWVILLVVTQANRNCFWIYTKFKMSALCYLTVTHVQVSKVHCNRINVYSLLTNPSQCFTVLLQWLSQKCKSLSISHLWFHFKYIISLWLL